ncbi:MAG: BrnT family toxin [Candidatus Levybacteria bacterium]|nr:BrnT family toxin [Candidatus Levybacteria bacterium]
MKYFDWDKGKNEWLKEERGVCFEDVIHALDEGNELDRISHPNKKRYPNQKMIIVNIENYAYTVPFVEDEKKVFLKTIIPSRKMTKKYLIRGK